MKKFRKKWLKEGEHSNAFTHIRRITHYVADILQSGRSLPKVETITPDHWVVEGKKVLLSSFAKMYEMRLAEVKGLFEELTAGISTELSIPLDEIVDVMDLSQAGHSFLGKKTSPTAGMQGRLLHWAATKGGFVIREDKGTLIWNKRLMTEFMQRVGKMWKLVMILM